MADALVVNGAVLKCSMGDLPAPLKVLPAAKVMAGGLPAGDINTTIPVLNIPPFGKCKSLTNPATAAATAAAKKLTPEPCVPVPAGPWIPGSPAVLIGGRPALNASCLCMCAYAGVVSVESPGQETVEG